MVKKLDIKKGSKFGRLNILIETTGSNKYRKFNCKCDCGIVGNYFLSNLINGNTKSCGCLNDDVRVTSNTTHGMAKSRIYKIWAGMKHRCDNKNNQAYLRYGARGISYDPRWKSFEEFYEDIGLDYERHFIKNNGDTSIDRIDNNGNYYKENCRWATRSQQGKNKRNNINYKGKCITEWCEKLGIHSSPVRDRIQNGWDIKKALFTPINKTKDTRSIAINQYTLKGEFIKSWVNMVTVKKELGINNSAISLCCHGKQKTAGGFIWKFKK